MIDLTFQFHIGMINPNKGLIYSERTNYYFNSTLV